MRPSPGMVEAGNHAQDGGLAGAGGSEERSPAAVGRAGGEVE